MSLARGGKAIPEEVVLKILRMDAEGLRHSIIAERFGISPNSISVLISKIRNRHRGLTTKRNEWEEERTALADQYLSTNITQAQLARERRTTMSALHKRLAREGVDKTVRDELLDKIPVKV